jgi:ABC-type multidrug transport system fused ATPase/permease subunit
VIALLAVRVAAQYTQDVLLATATQSAVWRVRGAVVDRLLALDLPFYEVCPGRWHFNVENSRVAARMWVTDIQRTTHRLITPPNVGWMCKCRLLFSCLWQSDDGCAGDLAYRLSTETELAADVVWAATQRAMPGVLHSPVDTSSCLSLSHASRLTLRLFLSTALVQMVVIGGRMVEQSPMLTLCCMGCVVAMALTLPVLGQRVRTRAAAAQAAQAALAGHATDTLQAMPVVITHHAARSEAVALAALAHDASAARIRQVITAQRTRWSVTLHTSGVEYLCTSTKYEACTNTSFPSRGGAQAAARAAIPGATTLLYGATVCALAAAAAASVRSGAADPGGVAAFLASLVLLVEPVQAVRRTLYN